MTDERHIDRMEGCSSLGKTVLSAGAVVLGLFWLLNHHSSFPSDSDILRLSVKSVIADLRAAILSYGTDFHRFPIQDNGKSTEDVVTRSRGILLQVLQGENISMLNPREVRYAEFPTAQEHKRGLWQDGEEWVLGAPWGEPFYIILDINKDNQVPNPEFGANTSDPKQAKFAQKYPPPQRLPMPMAIYSSGPDRDPDTWHDNICSWLRIERH
ncbi:MAG: hypothetical protein B7Z37_12020 [Verrucomicrobia bacterium 12-59-8]|nr:MAG: hypothetical protein B7Z37_12020 [Verrucomicrobia bacterium 12-59-8]